MSEITEASNSPRQPAAGAGSGGSLSDGAAVAQEKAQEVAGQAQEKVQAAAAQAQAKLREQLDQRSAQVAAQINEQASDLRSVSGALREQGKDGPAKAADRLAEYAEKLGSYLHDRSPEALLHDAEDFGRRQPAAAAGGGLLLGFLGSRFLKASSSQRYAARGADRSISAPAYVPPRPAGAGSWSPTPGQSAFAAAPPASGARPPEAGVPPFTPGV